MTLALLLPREPDGRPVPMAEDEDGHQEDCHKNRDNDANGDICGSVG